ncbi:YheC/YheD family protein [Bacillus sp. S/N-304-OC-R1]|uniref:YheC/YheD family protein n=1 Tax=Bacillus sp. S/N-304-OC-R1 TaxID=2758034 RepID=UPI001C8DBE28|nr:YheC/YheD family protein [Bacillus sp. S/N-304-OC-R1]MBY0121276.1 YheC/YheD family protein [Bacillus sp. S/N-304-OC-R1]
MRAIVGRIGQYRILSSKKKLRKHLLETELFSEGSFNKFADTCKSFVIKPLLGPEEISITSTRNQFRILSNPNITSSFTKDDLYQYLKTYELKNAYYVIQPNITILFSSKSPFHYYVTLHRQTKHADWQLISKTEMNRSSISKFFYMYFMLMIWKLSYLAAEKLGQSYPNCRTVVIEILYDLKGGIWIKDSFIHFSRSKWSQFLSLSANKAINPFIPATDLLTKVSFNQFLSKYNKVMIKPYDGQHGLGIVQITANDDLSYEIHSGIRKITMQSIEEAFQYLNEYFLSKKYYIIQERLPLALINECPIDIRVLTQKKDSEWKVTGKLVKVAGNGFIVTNAAQKLLSLEDAFNQSNLTDLNFDSLKSRIDEICKLASEQLEKSYPDSYIIGFDIGMSRDGDIWIIEANFKPDLSMFYELEDKSMYQNISQAKRKKE